MTIEITSKQISITTPIREKIQSRFEKLEKMQIPLINPHVIITKEPKGVKIEASISIPSGKLFAQAEHDDLYAAITLLGQKLERQLNKHLHKPEARRGSESIKRQNETPVEPIEEEEVA